MGIATRVSNFADKVAIYSYNAKHHLIPNGKLGKETLLGYFGHPGYYSGINFESYYRKIVGHRALPESLVCTYC